MALAYTFLFVVALNGEGPVEPALRFEFVVLAEADREYHA